MKPKATAGLILAFFLFTTGAWGQTPGDDRIPLAPVKNRRPPDFRPFIYPYSLQELKEKFSEELIRKAAIRHEKVKSVNETGKWRKPEISWLIFAILK